MLISIGTNPITTPRLVLRRFSIWDSPKVYENWASLPQVAQYMRWAPHASPKYTSSVVRQWVKDYRDPLNFHWAITLLGNDAPVGSMRLFVNDYSDDRGEVGYSLCPTLWGQGFMEEALTATLRYGFDKVGFHRIEGYCSTQNPASARVMEKCGMVREGLFPGRSRIYTGEYVDCYGYATFSQGYPPLLGGEREPPSFD